MARILIVDDSNYLRATLRTAFEKAGHEVVAEADNGEDAVEQYAKHRPDACTMDIVMPKGNGLQAITQIMEFDPDARIIVITALGHEPMIRKALSFGALNFVIKPAETEEVLQAVDGVLSGM
ncbi:MAG: response regulator [Candidatus Heimdallarchaeota archaeon]|nr:response regulator [Candidatus Heimdallarchaeota archaeon]